MARTNSQTVNKWGRHILCHIDLLWLTVLKSSNSWIQVFKISTVFFTGEMGQGESEGGKKLVFEVNGFYTVPGNRSHQTDIKHCSGFFLDDFYSPGCQHYALVC